MNVQIEISDEDAYKALEESKISSNIPVEKISEGKTLQLLNAEN